MAKKDTTNVTAATKLYTYWQRQLGLASKDMEQFYASGDIVVDKYRNEKQGTAGATLNKMSGGDKYNILYSSTETVRPSLYASTPKVEGQLRHKDRSNPTALAAVMVLESCVTYAMEDLDFDEMMTNAIEDYTLPGMGQAWVRYLPTFKQATDGEGEPLWDDDKKTVPAKIVDFEELGVDYINWKDFLMGRARTWAEVPWVAKRVYMTKDAATSAFGAAVADKLSYTSRDITGDRNNGGGSNGVDQQAIIWEIWHKRKKEVIWYSEGFKDGVLKTQDDPLRLKKFFPCPKPLRAISNTKTMVPRCFYSQYQAQAEEIDNLTSRIRHLTNALVVRGVYDGSAEKLSTLLSPTPGNRMIPIDNWQQFASNGGVAGSVQWVPIKDIAQVLMQLMQARDTAKAEIYEITGFSDILRGVSKASETLGAQEIKNDWGSARLRVMQKEVQRFARDIVRLMAEVISEHFTEETLAVYSGFDPNNVAPMAPQQAPQAPPQPPMPGQPPMGPPQGPQGAPPALPAPPPSPVEQFRAAVALLKSEKERCAWIGIETDSTILPDEASERKDRLEFTGQIGAFLQQAGPMVMQFPDMRGLLGAIMMFSVRSFRSSRPLEQEFEKFQKAIQNMPPTDPNAKQEGGDPHAAQAQVASEQAKQQGAVQIAQITDATERYKIDTEARTASEKVQSDAAIAQQQSGQRHAEYMLELQIKLAELDIKKAELGISDRAQALEEASAVHEQALAAGAQDHDHALEANDQQHAQNMDMIGQENTERQISNDENATAAQAAATPDENVA